MKIVAVCLTFNHKKTGREQMFWDTWDSLAPVERIVITNGSTDGTQDVVKELGGIVDDTDSRIWYGMQTGIDEAIRRGGDLILFTADDITYKDGWADRLAAFWEDAPDEVRLCSLILEPQYPWNTIRGTLEAGGERAILRDSVGGCSWSFRAKDWPDIGPLPQVQPGEDIPVCNKLIERGDYIAQIDLGDHVGEAHSAWGNQSHLHAVPLDRERWKI
jgi:glycosyltransferase involved in cell wall biosynthesis